MGNLDKDFMEFMIKMLKMSGADNLTASIVGALFIEPDEVSMEAIAKKTGYSLASVSNKVRILEMHRLVKKGTKPGSKKIYLYMEKNIIKMWKDQLIRTHQIKIKAIKENVPGIILKYQSKKLTDKEKRKLKILKEYHEKVLKFEKILQKMIVELGKIEK